LNNLIANSNLLSDTKTALIKAKNSLSTHLKQDDLVGALGQTHLNSEQN
jgi:hypothetical protein